MECGTFEGRRSDSESGKFLRGPGGGSGVAEQAEEGELEKETERKGSPCRRRQVGVRNGTLVAVLFTRTGLPGLLEITKVTPLTALFQKKKNTHSVPPGNLASLSKQSVHPSDPSSDPAAQGEERQYHLLSQSNNVRQAKHVLGDSDFLLLCCDDQRGYTHLALSKGHKFDCGPRGLKGVRLSREITSD